MGNESPSVNNGVAGTDRGSVPVPDTNASPRAPSAPDSGTDAGTPDSGRGTARSRNPRNRPRTNWPGQDAVGGTTAVLDGLSASQIFAESSVKPPKPRELKPIESITQMVNMPFAATGLVLHLLGDTELAELMPLEPGEEKQLTDAIFTALKGNPKLLAALEKASGNISLVGLAMTLGTVMAPRVAAIQRTYANRANERNAYANSPSPDNGVPRPGGGGTVESGVEPPPPVDAGSSPRITGNVALRFSETVAGKG